jgi:hypothetical protein
VQYKCVLCFKVLSNKSDINFLDSKDTVRKELDDLSFSISPTNSICKACLALGNKWWNGEASKNGLICELEPRQYNNEHAQNSIINAIGIPLKVQRNVVRKLGYFERLFDFRNWMSWQASSLQQPNSLYEWQELFSPFRHVFNGWVYIYSQGLFLLHKVCHGTF